MQGSRILGSDILNLSDGILSVVSEVTFSYVLKVKDNTGSGVRSCWPVVNRNIWAGNACQLRICAVQWLFLFAIKRAERPVVTPTY